MKKSSVRLEGGGSLAGEQLGMQGPALNLKMRCAMELNDHLDKLDWTQQRIGRELGLSQPHVSELRNYALDRFSADRLLHFMAALGKRVSIRIEEPGSGEENLDLPTVTIEVTPPPKKVA